MVTIVNVRISKNLFIILGLLGLDLVTKLGAQNYLANKKTIELIPKILELVYIENSGFAFSLGSNLSYLLIIIYLFALGVLVVVYRKLDTKIEKLLILLVSAGVLGNGVDRAFDGKVIDFISLNHFAVFNLADIYITISLGLYAFLQIKKR
jgi:signal peptidase II